MNSFSKILVTFLLLTAGVQAQNEVYTTPVETEIADTTFVRLRDYSNDFIYDMKYATEDNFLKAKVYDCAECMLRLKTVKALIAANNDFLKGTYDQYLFTDVSLDGGVDATDGSIMNNAFINGYYSTLVNYLP